MIAVDTHVLLWWTLDPDRLSPRARRAVAEADRVGVPAIVFWEVALLARSRRVSLGTSVATWTHETLSLPRLEPLALTPEVAIAAEDLPMRPDPADRFIVATARQHGCDLVTKDRAIQGSGLVAVVW